MTDLKKNWSLEHTPRIIVRRCHFWSNTVSVFIEVCGRFLWLNSAERGGQLEFIPSIHIYFDLLPGEVC